MKEFFEFFRIYAKWLVLAIYIALSCALLFQSDPYRHNLYLTTASTTVGALYQVGNNVTSFFSLREVNEDLNHRNAVLEAEVVNLREEIERMKLSGFTDTMPTPDSVAHFDFIVANVVNNSIHHAQNYVTLDKGTNDGVHPEMGVIDHSGVVGTVSTVGPHYARVISLLNPNFRLSCKIKSTDYFGSLVWDGVNPDEALLEELPRQTRFETGDTVVTSGHSALFPAGLPVGIIMPDQRNHNENFFTLRIKLFADFSRLSNVQIVVNNRRQELMEVENTNVINYDPAAK